LTPQNRRMRWALLVVTAIFIALVAAVFRVTSDEVDGIRGDFCEFAASVSAGAHKLPQVNGRVQAEQAYAHLQEQLGC